MIICYVVYTDVHPLESEIIYQCNTNTIILFIFETMQFFHQYTLQELYLLTHIFGRARCVEQKMM